MMVGPGIIALYISGLLGSQILSESSIRCEAQIDNFINSKPIAVLPTGERSQIGQALLPDVTRSYRIGGGKPNKIRPDGLKELLRFKVIAGGRSGEQLMIVRVVDDSCGAQDNCGAYVISLTPAGARSVLVGRDPSFGESAGGASGFGILQQPGSSYPELLFLSHISAFETAIECFTWNGSRYVYGSCTPECAHFLDRPRPN
jgi:hypothetical protein